MAAKGKIVNTTPKGRHAPARQVRVLWDSAKLGTFNRGRNAQKRRERARG